MGRQITLVILVAAFPVGASVLRLHAQPDARRYEIAVQTLLDGVVRLRPDGSEVARLDTGGMLLPTSWSPDGRRLALWGLSHGLIITNVDGTGRESLVPNVPVEPFFVWSPDSTRIAFSSTFEDPAGPNLPRGTLRSSAVYVMDIRTQQMRRLSPFGQNRFVAWSPDGRRIAYAGTEPGAVKGDIDVVEVDSGRVQHLVSAPTNNTQPAWSPRGDQLAFVAAPMPGRTPPEQSGVFIVQADGSSPRRIWPGLASSVAWSPDGRLALIRFDPSPVITLSTGAFIELRNGGIDGTFTPDSQHVVSRVPGTGTPVMIIDIDGRHPRTLANGSAFAVSPFLGD